MFIPLRHDIIKQFDTLYKKCFVMIDLRNLFKNNFNTSRISDDTMRKGSQDHLARLAANNQAGFYNDMLNATQTEYNSFCAAIDAEDVNLATQQSSTLIVDNVLEDFKKSVSRYEGAVRAEFGATSSQYQEFFPQGQTEYALCNKSNSEMLIDRMFTLCRKYAGNLSSTMYNIFENFDTIYPDARTNQLNYIATTTVLKSQTAAARTRLELRISKNLLLIAAEFIGNPTILNTFFDQSIFRPNKSKDDGSYEEEISPSGITMLENKGITESTEISFKNKSNAILFIGFSEQSGILDINEAVKINGNETRTFMASDLGYIKDAYFNALNSSKLETARIEYLII